MGRVKSWLMDQQEAEGERLRAEHPDWTDEQIHDEIHKHTADYDEPQ